MNGLTTLEKSFRIECEKDQDLSSLICYGRTVRYKKLGTYIHYNPK
jgi:hypothetical protein